MKTINQVYKIYAPRKKVWEALTNSKIIEQWSGDKAVMNDKVGTKFKLWGDEIFGINKSIIPLKKIIQEWSTSTMEKPSILTFTLNGNDNTTTVTLLQTDVPDNEFKDIEDGWKEYYMLPLKKLVEKS